MLTRSGGGGHEGDAENSSYQKVARTLWQRHPTVDAESRAFFFFGSTTSAPSSNSKFKEVSSSLLFHAVQSCTVTPRGQKAFIITNMFDPEVGKAGFVCLALRSVAADQTRTRSDTFSGEKTWPV